MSGAWTKPIERCEDARQIFLNVAERRYDDSRYRLAMDHIENCEECAKWYNEYYRKKWA